MWELTILEAGIPASRLDSLCAGDVDRDGEAEILAGGDGLYWYRPRAHVWGQINRRYTHVGFVLADIDGDGLPELVTGESETSTSKDYSIVWYKPSRTLTEPWRRGVVDPAFQGHAHDVAWTDIDGDGQAEIIAVACYTTTPGIFAFKRKPGEAMVWEKYALAEGIFTEGLSIADLDGDGKPEIVCGPDWYTPPAAGALAGHWTRRTYAPSLREMCRTAVADIAGNGRLDIVVLESEYMDGRCSWFENPGGGPGRSWTEHRLLDEVVYGHSLEVRAGARGGTSIFLAEMQQGGWNAPYNHDARLLIVSTQDRGAIWRTDLVGKGEGTHQAFRFDVDGDGELEILGKDWGYYHHNPRLQMWKQTERPALTTRLGHRFVDRDKPRTGVEILACDVDGDGFQDIVCGAWWYRNPGSRPGADGQPGWERYDIPGVCQIINSHDIDGDGRQELIGIAAPARASGDFYRDLSSDLCWLKPLDPRAGRWEPHPIGRGRGDWPHGSLLGPFGPGGKLALAVAYHSAYTHPRHYPQYFVAPDDPARSGWSRRTLARIPYNEQMLLCDLAGSGRTDIIAGPWWLENTGDGRFRPHRYMPEGVVPARLALIDVAGSGRPGIVVGQQVADWKNRRIPMSALLWLERPVDARVTPWPVHVIDTLFYVHSLDVGDLDGDGEPEIVCAEHDPFRPYRSRCRMLVYKKADPSGRSWTKHVLDGRFEHHAGAKVFEVAPGRLAIASHGWKDSIYVHLWESVGPASC